MRARLAIALAPLALLASCGDGVPFTEEARAAYDICISGGGEAPYCTCVTTKLQKDLSPEAFTQMAKGGEDGDMEATILAIGAAHETCEAK